MLPEAVIVHRIPQRIRLKIPSKKGDRIFFSILADTLSRYSGVEKCSVNSTTGSVLLFPNVDVQAFASRAEAEGLFRLKESSVRLKPVHQAVLEPLEGLDQKLKSFSGGEIDLVSIAFLGFLGMGVYQLAIGNLAAPAWHAAFWYAMNTAFRAQPGASVGV